MLIRPIYGDSMEDQDDAVRRWMEMHGGNDRPSYFGSKFTNSREQTMIAKKIYNVMLIYG